MLDYGCGAGDGSAILARKGARSVLALDIGKRNIANGRKMYGKLKNLTFSRQDLNTYRLDEDKFDVIWSDTVIELLKREPDDIAGGLYGALRPGGILYVSLTEKTPFNIALYAVLRILNTPLLRPLSGLLKAAAKMRYRLSGETIDAENFNQKIKYLSIPYINLMSREQATAMLRKAGFRIEYVRDRIKSDPNSPPHFEIRAEKPA